jgi:hypothetical protein
VTAQFDSALLLHSMPTGSGINLSDWYIQDAQGGKANNLGLVTLSKKVYYVHVLFQTVSKTELFHCTAVTACIKECQDALR